MQLPAGSRSGSSPISPPPRGKEHEEPAGHRKRNEGDEPRADEPDQRNHDRGAKDGGPKSLELAPPHLAQKLVVLLAWDLLRVPGAAAGLTFPALTVRKVSFLAALAADR